MAETRVVHRAFLFVELHGVRIEQHDAGGFGTRQVQRALQNVVHHVHAPRIPRAHNRQVLFAQLLLNVAQALGEKRASRSGERDVGMVVVAGAGGIDGHQFVETRP